MKIVDNRRFEKVFCFAEIQLGDVFSLISTDNNSIQEGVYIKIASDSSIYNAFNIKTNERAQLSYTTKVAIIDAEVILE